MFKIKVDKGFITLLFGRVLQLFFALITLRCATTFLDPLEMGKVSLVMTTVSFFALFFINPAGMFINRRLHAWRRGGTAKFYLERYPIFLIVVAVIAGILLYVICNQESLDFGMPYGWVILLVCGSLIFNTINQTSIPSLNLLGDAFGFVMLTVSTLAASLMLAVILAWGFDASAQYWVLGLLAGQAFLSIIGVQRLFKLLDVSKVSIKSSAIKASQIKSFLKFGWPISLAAGLVWIQSQSYRYILGSESGFSDVGLFAAGYGLSAGLIAGFEALLTSYLQPRLYRDADLGDQRKQFSVWQTYANVLIPSAFLVVSLVIAISPELTFLFMGKNFQAASNFVLWGAFAELARVLIGVYSLIGHLQMRTNQLVLPSLAGALLSMALSILLIPSYGSIGAGISLVCSGYLTLVLMYFVLLGREALSIDWKNTLNKSSSIAVFWILVGLVRYAFDSNELLQSILIVGGIGISFLVLQYRILRLHLNH